MPGLLEPCIDHWSTNIAALLCAVFSPLSQICNQGLLFIFKLHVVQFLYLTCRQYKAYINPEADVGKILLLQTLTGKEIEIDIEPTDKVNTTCNTLVCVCVCALPPLCWLPFCAGSVFKSRWSASKRGWRRRKASLRSSKDSSTVGNRCECLHPTGWSSSSPLWPF